MKRAYWRQGVDTECINELSNFAFNELGMSKISLMIDDKNYKSINLAIKLD
ncbi:MAG: GNAT family N-acetyltransferase [Clostridium sp.]